MKLDTPGERDGVFELWIDGKLEAVWNDLDWHGSWGEHAINAVFLEDYWNQGSMRRQARWIDDFVISTQPIGPITASKPPTIFRAESAVAFALVHGTMPSCHALLKPVSFPPTTP